MGDRPESSEDLLAGILGNQQGEQSSLHRRTRARSLTQPHDVTRSPPASLGWRPALLHGHVTPLLTSTSSMS
jgi:hypothetical protein